MIGQTDSFWNSAASEVLKSLDSSINGLSATEAGKRLILYGSNRLKPQKRTDSLSLLISQFKSPIIMILLFATGVSFFLHDTTDALIIISIVLISGLLGFWQERGASNAVQKLFSIVQIKADVIRDGTTVKIPVDNIVPGDIVNLSAGAIIPGDGLVLETNNLFVDEAMLTGETFPVEKSVQVLTGDIALANRTNSLWMGTHVASGSAKMLVVFTGKNTEFGKVSERLKLRPLETEFERGIRQFGYFLMEVTLLMVVAIFAINVYLQRPVMDSFLFSLALAVGLTPSLLPAIISINLAHGAKHMADKKVIVKRLSSIENFGSMNVICSDKTGTLTEGNVQLQSVLDVDSVQSDRVFLYAYLNAYFETGFTNPIDEAIRNYRKPDITGYKKIDEMPYDFHHKRLSILVSSNNQNLLVTKGALLNVLEICTKVETADGSITDIINYKDKIQKHFEEFSSQGYRTLGIAYKNMGTKSKIVNPGNEEDADMTFSGFLVLFDPPKSDILKTVTRLKDLGVSLKVITGDNYLVATNISKQIGLSAKGILTGTELTKMSDSALLSKVSGIDVFAEIEPNQKERIIISLKKAGNVVGYMGDGMNDASAIHAADVGISVDSAVDVAKDAADIVLLEKDLGVLIDGVLEGRATFANTLKYVFMATSANFGNMFSMAGVSLILPFLPLLPRQVLLTNLMTDLPEMTIASDNVDREMIDFPHRWDIKAIRKFMITFGIVSSVFDYLTFGSLGFIMHATQVQFRTAWFLESVISAALIVLVIRTRKTAFKSNPGKFLLMATVFTIVITSILPYSPLSSLLGFEPLSISFLILIVLIVCLYIITAEIVKRIFNRIVKF